MKLIWINVAIITVVLFQVCDGQNKTESAAKNQLNRWAAFSKKLLEMDQNKTGKGDNKSGSVLNFDKFYGKLKIDKKFGNLDLLNKPIAKGADSADSSKKDDATSISMKSIMTTYFTFASFWVWRNFC